MYVFNLQTIFLERYLYRESLLKYYVNLRDIESKMHIQLIEVLCFFMYADEDLKGLTY